MSGSRRSTGCIPGVFFARVCGIAAPGRRRSGRSRMRRRSSGSASAPSSAFGTFSPRGGEKGLDMHLWCSSRGTCARRTPLTRRSFLRFAASVAPPSPAGRGVTCAWSWGREAPATRWVTVAATGGTPAATGVAPRYSGPRQKRVDESYNLPRRAVSVLLLFE